MNPRRHIILLKDFLYGYGMVTSSVSINPVLVNKQLYASLMDDFIPRKINPSFGCPEYHNKLSTREEEGGVEIFEEATDMESEGGGGHSWVTCMGIDGGSGGRGCQRLELV